MSNVLFVKPYSQYDAMRNYIDEIEVGFRLAGYDTYVIDAKEQSFEMQIQEIANYLEIDIIFTCNATVTYTRAVFPNAYYITYLCDHPASHMERLKDLDDRSMVFTCDKHHEEYIKRYCQNIKYVKFIPLSGSYSKRYVPFHMRSKDIVFTGSYIKPEILHQRIFDNASEMQEIAEYMADSIIENSDWDLEMCVMHSLDHFGMVVSDQEFHEMTCRFHTVDLYARFYYRDKIIRKLLENGLQIHVYGNGWETFEGEGIENLIIEKGNFYVAQKAVAKAKISINTMPWFKEGFQERIATAMLSGTVAVTDRSKYIDENFVDGQDLVLYSLNELDELPSKVKWLLAHPDVSEQIAQRAKVRAENEMTWQHKAFEMIEFMILQCHQLVPDQMQRAGKVLQIPKVSKYDPSMPEDVIDGMNEIIDMILQVQTYDQMDKCDIDYFYTKFTKQCLQKSTYFSKITNAISESEYNYLMNITEEQTDIGTSLLLKECREVLSVFLDFKNRELITENQQLRYQIRQTDIAPNQFSQQILVKKLELNYGMSKDNGIQEILKNIKKDNHVEAYNQDFVEKYANNWKNEIQAVQYDSQAEMYYADWNGKKMYYPKEYTNLDVAAAINFVHLEQDMESPHRYLDESFTVDEGDIVIDAGVAEGNFALDIVDKAKKIYLVECEHKWIEALKKTFEPWSDKVVIIEKMLGNKDNDEFASIDEFVEEGYVNFIKMDVEGAEIDSLMGASKILRDSQNIKCAICAYHRRGAEEEIRKILEANSFYTATTKGYMFFKEDMDSWIYGELRHGLVRAKKCL